MTDFFKSDPNFGQKFMQPRQQVSLGNYGQQFSQSPEVGAANFMSPQFGVEAPSAATATGQFAGFGGGPNTSPYYGADIFKGGSGGGAPKTDLPFAEGKWATNAKLGLGAAQVGLGIYNAMEQSKMNKFMQSYYNTQMDLMKTDFSNAAKSSNEALHSREQRRLSAQGHDIDSQEMEQGVANTMARWGAKETV